MTIRNCRQFVPVLAIVIVLLFTTVFARLDGIDVTSLRDFATNDLLEISLTPRIAWPSTTIHIYTYPFGPNTTSDKHPVDITSCQWQNIVDVASPLFSNTPASSSSRAYTTIVLEYPANAQASLRCRYTTPISAPYVNIMIRTAIIPDSIGWSLAANDNLDSLDTTDTTTVAAVLLQTSTDSTTQHTRQLFYDTPRDSQIPTIIPESQLTFHYTEVLLGEHSIQQTRPTVQFWRFGGNSEIFVDTPNYKCTVVSVFENNYVAMWDLREIKSGISSSYLGGYITLDAIPLFYQNAGSTFNAIYREVTCIDASIRPSRSTTPTNFALILFSTTLQSSSAYQDIAPIVGPTVIRPGIALIDSWDLRITAVSSPPLCIANTTTWLFGLTSGIKLYKDEYITIASPSITSHWNAISGFTCQSDQPNLLECTGQFLNQGPACTCRALSTQTLTNAIAITAIFEHPDFNGMIVEIQPVAPGRTVGSSGVEVTWYTRSQPNRFNTIITPNNVVGDKIYVITIRGIVNAATAQWRCDVESQQYQISQDHGAPLDSVGKNVYDLLFWVPAGLVEPRDEQSWLWFFGTGNLESRSDPLFANYNPMVYMGEVPVLGMGVPSPTAPFSTTCFARIGSTYLKSVEVECNTKTNDWVIGMSELLAGVDSRYVRIGAKVRVVMDPGVPAGLFDGVAFPNPNGYVYLQEAQMPPMPPVALIDYNFTQNPSASPYHIDLSLVNEQTVITRNIGDTFRFVLNITAQYPQTLPLNNLILKLTFDTNQPCVDFTQMLCDDPTRIRPLLGATGVGFYADSLLDKWPFVDSFSTTCQLQVLPITGDGSGNDFTCKFGIQYGVPIFPSGRYDDDLQEIVATYDHIGYSTIASNSSLDFTIATPKLPQWRCKWRDDEYIQCNDAKWSEVCQEETPEDPCLCTNKRVPICFDPNNNMPFVDTSRCAIDELESVPQTDVIVNFRSLCEGCVTSNNATQRFGWGPQCDIMPTIANFTYYPQGTLIEDFIDDDGVIIKDIIMELNTYLIFNMSYQGSPSNYITITAKSPSLAPFTTLIIASIPAVSPYTDFIFDLSTLGIAKEIANLEFFASVGDVAKATFTLSSTSQVIKIKTLPRCQSLDGSDLCQNGGTCNPTTGQCTCNKNTIYQAGALCQKSICPSLHCAIENVIGYDAMSDLEQFVENSCLIKPGSDGVVQQPTCNCASTWTGPRCSIPLTCQQQFPSNICPATRGTAEFQVDPITDEPTNKCHCNCDGHWQSVPNQNQKCTRCTLQCSNNGRDTTGRCKQCTCPASGSIRWYGTTCNCAGIALNARVPINSDQFAVIREERRVINELVARLEGEQQLENNNGNILALIQESPFKSFLQSFFISLLLDFRTQLLRQGDHAVRLYTFDPLSQQYVVNVKSLSDIVILQSFDVDEIQIDGDDDDTDTPTISKYVTYAVLIVPDACYDAGRVVDDRAWNATLNSLHTVANYLADADLVPNQDISQDKNPIDIELYDPECKGASCQTINPPEPPKEDNTGSFNFSTIFTFVLMNVLLVLHFTL